MFKSIEYLRWDGKNYIYKLIDDDFEVETIDDTSGVASYAAKSILKVYINKLYTFEQIGENFALFIMWYADYHYWSIEQLVKHLDSYISVRDEIKQYRDKYLKLFILFQ